MLPMRRLSLVCIVCALATACNDPAGVEGPGPPASLIVVGGDGQLDLPGAALSVPLVARVVDRFGVPVPGVEVSWEADVGDGVLSDAELETDAAGEASATLTLGSAIGSNVVTATHGDLAPIEFESLALAIVQSDAADDTFFSGGVGRLPPDLLAFGAAWDGDSLIIALAFKDSVAPARSGEVNAVTGVVEFDIDLDEGTGRESLLDTHRPGPGSTGMGVDILVDLYDDEGGDYLIFDWQPAVVGSTMPDVRGRLISFGVPSALLGGDALRFGAIVGTAAGPTDIAPNDSSVLIGAAGG
jgi:hypothetical protein